MKKAVIVSLILLCSLTVISVVFAEQQTKQTCVLGWGEGCIIPTKPIQPIPQRQTYDIQMANGVAVDRYYMTTKPVLFVIFRYQWDTKTYLILDGEFYNMEQIESRYDWNTNTRMFKYRTDDGNVMTLAAQEFSGGITVSATFKNYIITFEPIGYEVQNTEPIVRETPIMPLMPTFKQLTQGLAQDVGGMKAGVSTETMISQAKPIADWSQKGK